MINVSFPDGSKREYPDGSTPLSIAESISKSLAKRSVIARVNGELRDMKRPLEGDASLELLRHQLEGRARRSCATTPRTCSRRPCRNSFPERR